MEVTEGLAEEPPTPDVYPAEDSYWRTKRDVEERNLQAGEGGDGERISGSLKDVATMEANRLPGGRSELSAFVNLVTCVLAWKHGPRENGDARRSSRWSLA